LNRTVVSYTASMGTDVASRLVVMCNMHSCTAYTNMHSHTHTYTHTHALNTCCNCK